jgi:hypothetical protein
MDTCFGCMSKRQQLVDIPLPAGILQPFPTFPPAFLFSCYSVYLFLKITFERVHP